MKDSLILIIVLLLAAISPLVNNLYLSSLPTIQSALMTSTHLVQLTIASSALGATLGQPFYGPLSDALGRRHVLLVGLLIATIGALLCFSAHNIYVLLGGRFIQGLGLGSAALSRAISRDRVKGVMLSKRSSMSSIIKIIMVNCAPLAGAYIEKNLGWRANFGFILIYLILVLLAVLLALPETNQHRDRNKLKWSKIVSALAMLFSHREFIGSCLVLVCSFGSLYAWITISPILLIRYLNLTPTHYGWLMASASVIYIGSMLMNILTVERFGTTRMITSGLILALFGGITMMALTPLHSWLAITVAIYIFTAGLALVTSNSISSALTPFPEIAGIASSLTRFFQLLGSATSSSFVAVLGLNSQLALGCILSALMITALLGRKLLE